MARRGGSDNRHSVKSRGDEGHSFILDPLLATGPAVLCLACALITAAVYVRAIQGEFCWDDRLLITNNDQALDEWSDIFRGFTTPLGAQGAGYYRPGLMATFVVDRQLAGENAGAFHRTNLILHILNVTLVWAVLFAYTRNRISASFGALLFSVHPIQVQAVALIAGRNELLLVPPLAGLLLVYRAWHRATGRRRWWLHGALAALFALSLWTKETALLFPALLLVLDILVLRPPRQALSSRLPLLVSFATVAAVYFVTRWQVFGTLVSAGQYGNPSTIERILMVIATYGYYIRQLLIPIGLSPAPFHAAMIEPGSRYFLVALIGCAGFGLALLWALRRNPVFSFGMITFALCILPAAGFIPMKMYMLEPRVYSGMLGIAFAVGALLQVRQGSDGEARADSVRSTPISDRAQGGKSDRKKARSHRRRSSRRSLQTGTRSQVRPPTVTRKPSKTRPGPMATIVSDERLRWRIVPAFAAVLVFAAWTFARVPVYREALSLWPAAVAAVPKSSYARYEYGFQLMKAKRSEEGIRQLRESVLQDPNDANARYGLAWWLEQTGGRVEAISELRQLLRRHPRDLRALNTLGVFLLRERRFGEAQKVSNYGLRFSSKDPKLLFNLGNALEGLEKPGEAVDVYQRLIKMAPNKRAHLVSLGRALRKVERYTEAATAFERALEIGPETGALQFALGSALWKSGDGAKAASHAKRAAQLGYEDPGVPSLIDELTRAGFLPADGGMTRPLL